MVQVGTQEDTLRITELLGKAIKVSGASAVEAKSAMLQFGQALGSGKLAGDELRSLMENAPYLMRQLADGIGVPVGALKKLGEEGKLTAEVVTNALSKAATQIDADFQKFPQTIESAMDVAIDAAGRANSKLDELTGTSAALTGIAKGVGVAFDFLAKLFGDAAGEADALGRNKSIQTWADGTTRVLSYVMDAADFVTRAIKEMGIALGGVAASAAMALQGNFKASSDTLKAMLADIMAVSDPMYAGKKFRQQMDSPEVKLPTRPGHGSSGPSRPLKSGGGGDDKGKAAFDQLAYLATLKRGTVEGWDAINAKEAEALRKSQSLLDQGKISKKNHEEAVTLITRTAVMDRQDLMAQETDSYIKEMSRDYQARQAAQKAREELEARQKSARQASTLATLGMNAEGGGVDAQVALIQAQAQAAMDAAEQARLLDLENSQIYADQKTAIEAKMHRDIEALRNGANAAALSSTVDIFGSLMSITKNAAGEQSDAYKVMFAAQKAASIAQSIVAIQTGIAQASALPFPANLAAMATVAASTAGIISTIQSTSIAGGRQYGGAVSGGSLYRVNEKGAPEMYTASNGTQYMLPTAGGRVTAADKLGGGGITIINNTRTPIGQVTQETKQNGDRAIYIHEAVAAVNAAMSDPNSATSRAMGLNFSIQRSR